MTALAWLGAVCGGWLLISAAIMYVAVKRAPRHDDWE